jgi:CrcB protein
MEYLRNILWVAAGGALGASLRYLTYVSLMALKWEGFWGTLIVNVVGSFLMGLLFSKMPKIHAKYALFVLTGCLGAFTTFSTFSADTVGLMQVGRVWLAFFYVALNLIGSCGAFFLGWVIAAKTHLLE